MIDKSEDKYFYVYLGFHGQREEIEKEVKKLVKGRKDIFVFPWMGLKEETAIELIRGTTLWQRADKYFKGEKKNG